MTFCYPSIFMAWPAMFVQRQPEGWRRKILQVATKRASEAEQLLRLPGSAPVSSPRSLPAPHPRLAGGGGRRHVGAAGGGARVAGPGAWTAVAPPRVRPARLCPFRPAARGGVEPTANRGRVCPVPFSPC